MKITVVTSYGPKGFVEYGRHFLQGFDKHMPADWGLVVYHENDPIPAGLVRRPVIERDLLKLNHVRRFRRRHRANLASQGKVAQPSWKDSERRKGYSFRTDAYKFFRKPMAIWDAVMHLEAGVEQWVVWIDADTRFHRSPNATEIKALFPDHADVTYLGRPWMHSECGWLGLRLPAAWAVVDTWANMYRSDAFLAEAEWHDSYLFDRVRERRTDVRFVPINSQSKSAHPWFDSPLGGFSDHLKGPRRKARGWSIKPHK